MRVLVTGATGNVGTALLRRLADTEHEVLALTQHATGGVNLASDEVVDRARFTALYDALLPPLPLAVVRTVADLSWRARIQPTDAGWIDLATQAPLLDTARARDDLGWAPIHSSTEVLTEFVKALQHRRSGPGPLLRDHPTDRSPS